MNFELTWKFYKNNYSVYLIEHAKNTPVQVSQNHHDNVNGLSNNELNFAIPSTELIIKNIKIGSKRMYCESVIIPTSRIKTH